MFPPTRTWGLTQQAVRWAWGLGGETTLPGSTGASQECTAPRQEAPGRPSHGSAFSLPPGIQRVGREPPPESRAAHSPLLPAPASLALPCPGRGRLGGADGLPLLVALVGHTEPGTVWPPHPERWAPHTLPRKDMRQGGLSPFARWTRWHRRGSPAPAQPHWETHLPWPGSGELQLRTTS